MQISLAAPVQDLQDDATFALGTFELKGHEVKRLTAGAYLSFIEPLMAKEMVVKPSYTEEDQV